jgi:hypothetical protein
MLRFREKEERSPGIKVIQCIRCSITYEVLHTKNYNKFK